MNQPKCVHCGNDDPSMMEIEVVASIRKIYCEICSKFTVQNVKKSEVK